MCRSTAPAAQLQLQLQLQLDVSPRALSAPCLDIAWARRTLTGSKLAVLTAEVCSIPACLPSRGSTIIIVTVIMSVPALLLSTLAAPQTGLDAPLARCGCSLAVGHCVGAQATLQHVYFSAIVLQDK